MSENSETTFELGTINTRSFWLDVLDRAGKTFPQNLIVFFGAGVTLLSVHWSTLLQSAGLAALVSVLLAVATATAVTSGNFLIDLADRAARTFAGSLVAAIPATGGFGDVDWGQAATIAGSAAVLSVATSLLSYNAGAAKGLPTLAPVAWELHIPTAHMVPGFFDNGGALPGPTWAKGTTGTPTGLGLSSADTDEGAGRDRSAG